MRAAGVRVNSAQTEMSPIYWANQVDPTTNINICGGSSPEEARMYMYLLLLYCC